MNAILGLQSHYSFHWGVSSPEELLAQAKRMGYTHVGIADYASLHAVPEIADLAGKHGVTPIYGVTLPFRGGGILALIDNALGYNNLCQLTTMWHKACGNDLQRHGGLPLLESAVGKDLVADSGLGAGLVFVADQADVWTALRQAGCNVRYRIGPTLAAPPKGVPCEATVFVPGPCLLTPDDFTTHRLLRAIGAATSMDRIPEADRWRPDALSFPVGRPDAVLSCPADYRERFALFADAIERADDLARQLGEFSLCRDTVIPPSPVGDCQGGESALARLRRLAYKGAAVRYAAVTPAVRDRLEMELDLIGRKGFAEYFLIVHDIVARIAGGDGRVRRGRSVTCGRGSGAASLVNYCLGVTNVDVMKHGLMFERFLNEGRWDPPDIDVDFAWDERDDVLRRVFDSYGNDRVARVANHNRYDWRGAFRAAARCLGYADPDITRHMRQSPSIYAEPDAGLSPMPGQDGGEPADRTGRKLSVLRRGKGSDWDRAAALAGRLLHIPHGISMHCGGVVVSSGLICRSVPTVMSRKGLPTIQWEKDGAEEMGLVKIDLLGNRSLAVIRDIVGAVAAETGIPEDRVIGCDPVDDPATCELVTTGQTFGVFYLESPAMRLLQAKAGRGDFAHTVIHSSIIRPAANSFINEYIARLRGKEWEEKETSLRGLFDESYGIPVYQEDVVKLAMALGKYDYTRADKLRKCLGKRDAKERLTEDFPELADSARLTHVSEDAIERCWRVVVSMTGYSFCKPHSASFAQVSYEAAYLRAHYPAYFIAAVLSNGGGYYSEQAYVSEAMRLGLRVLGPDVNTSGRKWRAERNGTAVRCGLMAVAGLSGRLLEQVEAERERNGAFADVGDFCRRVRPAGDEARRLALAGAFDALEPELNRPQIVWQAGIMSKADALSGDADGERSGALFAPRGGRRTALAAAGVPELPDYSQQQRWDAEYAALGFVPGQHPLCLFADAIEESAGLYRRRANPQLIDMIDLPRHVGGLVAFLAWPVTAKVVETKHGDAMMFQSFENSQALCEAVVFPEEFTKYHRLLGTQQALWVTGKVEEEFGVATVRVFSVEPARRGAEYLPAVQVPHAL